MPIGTRTASWSAGARVPASNAGHRPKRFSTMIVFSCSPSRGKADPGTRSCFTGLRSKLEPSAQTGGLRQPVGVIAPDRHAMTWTLVARPEGFENEEAWRVVDIEVRS